MMRTLLFSILILPFFLVPAVTYAADADFFGPIVPEVCNCPGAAPSYGCVLTVIQNVVNLAISLGIVAATLGLLYAGFVFMTSSGNPEKRTQARGLLINIFIGLVIVLCAWLIVDFIMKKLYQGENDAAGTFGPWNSILEGNANDQCILVVTNPTRIPGLLGSLSSGLAGSGGNVGANNPQGGGVANPVTGTRGCPNCVSLRTYGVTCTNSCNLDPAVAPRIGQLKNAFQGTWTVTEAYPPSTSHSNQCHNNGTCIDASFRGSTAYNATNIAAFASAARTAGLRPVFETFDCSLRDAARRVGVTAYCSSDSGYGHITGSHFSLYSH